MRFRGASRHVLIVVTGMAVAIAATSVLVITRAGADEDRCTRFREASRERAALVTGAGEEILVIGDSYAAGLGVRLNDSWPSRLPGTVRVDGFSGSGFSRGASPCGDLSYARRAPHSVRPGTSLVVVEGGLNDVDQPRDAVVEGFEALMAALGDRPVVVVGPVSAPARGARVAEVDALLAGLAARHDAAYLSMVDLDLPFLADGLHLTADGHRMFGDHVAAQLAAHTDRSASVGGTEAARAAG